MSKKIDFEYRRYAFSVVKTVIEILPEMAGQVPLSEVKQLYAQGVKAEDCARQIIDKARAGAFS